MPTAAARRAAEADQRREKAPAKATKPSGKKPRRAQNKSNSGVTKKTPQSKPKSKKTAPEKTRSDPATVAADINVKFKYSVIVGESKQRSQTVTICERMKLFDHPSHRFRLKKTQYVYFADLDTMKAYCKAHKLSVDFTE